MSVLLHIHFDFDPKTVNLNDSEEHRKCIPHCGSGKIEEKTGGS